MVESWKQLVEESWAGTHPQSPEPTGGINPGFPSYPIVGVLNRVAFFSYLFRPADVGWWLQPILNRNQVIPQFSRWKIHIPVRFHGWNLKTIWCREKHCPLHCPLPFLVKSCSLVVYTPWNPKICDKKKTRFRGNLVCGVHLTAKTSIPEDCWTVDRWKVVLLACWPTKEAGGFQGKIHLGGCGPLPGCQWPPGLLHF